MKIPILPGISLALATYNRPQSLPKLLDSVAEQKFVRFEMIDVSIVDDGSSEGKRAVLRDDYPFKLNYTYRERRRDDLPAVYSAWNQAIRAGNKDIVLLLGDDMTLHDSMLFTSQLYHGFNPDLVLISHLSGPAAEQYRYCVWPIQDGGTAIGGACSFRRTKYEEIGGFDEAFDGSMGFCDADFGMRLRASGPDVWLVGGITIYLDDRETGSHRDGFVKRWRDKEPGLKDRNWRILVERHPELKK